MTTRPSEPPPRRRLTGDLLLRSRSAADRPEPARPPLSAADPRRPALPASLFLGIVEPLPSDYYLG